MPRKTRQTSKRTAHRTDEQNGRHDNAELIETVATKHRKYAAKKQPAPQADQPSSSQVVERDETDQQITFRQQSGPARTPVNSPWWS